jgi:pimeloyl-ACP methyl ester carboxylesterase
MSVHTVTTRIGPAGAVTREAPRRSARLRREWGLFAAGTAAVVGHTLMVGSWKAAVVVGALGLAYVHLGPNLRAAAGADLAPLAALAAWMHVLHVRWDGFAATDLTGLLQLVAAAFFASSAVLALRARPRRRGVCRLLRAAAVAVSALLLVVFVVTPLAAAMWLTGKPRQPVTVELGLPHEDVVLHARDGVRLSGWYVPSRNGAAVVLVHGGGGNRGGVVRHARLLAAHGYGVLLYDERGRGRSGGQSNGMGWDWPQDVTAAVDWLEARHLRKVGVVGLSTGAEVAITAAAHDRRIDAVVSEGVIARSNADTRLQHDWSAAVYWRVAFAAIGVQTGDAEPEPLTQDLRRVAPRPLLLVVAGKNAAELQPSAAFRKAAGPTARTWIADTGHTEALQTFPRRYERRVVGFLDNALAPASQR